MKPFFPTFEEKWTKTPNIIFDEIVTSKETNMNDIRLLMFLIRNTLGYNREGKWVGVSRNDLIKQAGISNTQLTNTLTKCEMNEWILTYCRGEGTKKERYIFLNDQTNQAIVLGLEKGLFKIEDLEYLNERGIKELLERNNLYDLVGLDSYSRNGSSTYTSPVSGEVKQATPETGEDVSQNGSSKLLPKQEKMSPKTGVAKYESAQAPQGFADSLKTSIKDNSYKDISKDNNKEIVVASNVVSISEIESHKTLLKTIVEDRVSDATINTWIRHGNPDQILKAWYKANEVSGVEDIGAYVTWLLKDGITSLNQKRTKQTEPEQSHPFYEMMRAAEETAVTKEISEPEALAPQVTEISSQEVWANVLNDLQLKLSAPAFETWVKPLIVLDCTQNQIVIKAKDEFHKDWLEQRYSVMIRSAVITAMNIDVVVKFVV